ncbi:MAG: hypothetical protein K6D02_07205 [Lachnospiraceae bacterium]|nr:hypothetical protein [Lachnospiraceae bacterium]
MEGIEKISFWENRCLLESGGHRKRSFLGKSMLTGKWRASKKLLFVKIDACWKVEGIEKISFWENRCLLERGGHRKSYFLEKSMPAGKRRASKKLLFGKIDACWKVEGIEKISFCENRCLLESGGHRKSYFLQKSMPAGKRRASEKLLFVKIDACWKVEGIEKISFCENRCLLESGGHRKSYFLQKSMPTGKWRASKKLLFVKIDACWKVEGIEKISFCENRCLLKSGGHRKSYFLEKSMPTKKWRASEKLLFGKIDAC